MVSKISKFKKISNGFEPGIHRLTLTVPSALNQGVTMAAVKESYGMKGKSKWIVEAVKSFLDDPGWIDALEADRIAVKDKAVTVVFSQEDYEVLLCGVQKLLVEKPVAKNPQNQIIRGAMIWRLMGLDSRPLRRQMSELNSVDQTNK
jgi:hypothetical protein